MFGGMASYRGDDTTGFQSPAEGYVEPALELIKALGLDAPGLYPTRVETDAFRRRRGIHHGDILVANADADPTNDKICIAFLAGEVVLATLHQTDSGWAIERSSGEIIPVSEDVEVWALAKALVRTNV